MKKLISLLVLLACVGTAFGQTNAPSTNTVGSLLPGGLSQIATDFGLFFTDAQPYFGTNGTTLVGGGVLWSGSHVGGFADVTVFSLATNNQVTIGFAAAYLDGNWYDAGLNLKMGTTWNSNKQIPYIGSFYTWAESGVAYNLHAGHALTQNFAGVAKHLTIGGVNLYPFYAIGNISDRGGGPVHLFGINGKF